MKRGARDYFKWMRILAAANCYASGSSVNNIAAQANVSRATVRRWLKISGVLS